MIKVKRNEKKISLKDIVNIKTSYLPPLNRLLEDILLTKAL